MAIHDMKNLIQGKGCSVITSSVDAVRTLSTQSLLGWMHNVLLNYAWYLWNKTCTIFQNLCILNITHICCYRLGECTFIEDDEVATQCQIPVKLLQYKLCSVCVGNMSVMLSLLLHGRGISERGPRCKQPRRKGHSGEEQGEVCNVSLICCARIVVQL